LPKETYIFAKRDLHICQTRPANWPDETTMSAKRGLPCNHPRGLWVWASKINLQKETHIFVKRDLHICQKRSAESNLPTENTMSVKRDLPREYPYLRAPSTPRMYPKRPTHLPKEPTIFVKRDLRPRAPGTQRGLRVSKFAFSREFLKNKSWASVESWKLRLKKMVIAEATEAHGES